MRLSCDSYCTTVNSTVTTTVTTAVTTTVTTTVTTVVTTTVTTPVTTTVTTTVDTAVTTTTVTTHHCILLRYYSTIKTLQYRLMQLVVRDRSTHRPTLLPIELLSQLKIVTLI